MASFRLPRWAQITAAVVAVLAVISFVGSLNSYDEGHAAGVASVTPPPTPEPIPVPTPLVIEVPGPTEIIETVPAECTEAIGAADVLVQTLIQMPLEVTTAYSDYPDENLAEFGERVETIIAEFDLESLNADSDNYNDLAGDCMAVAP